MTFPVSRLPLLFGFAAAVVCLAFAAFTGHMWEDYLITFRASLNLAEGNGLVFQPGERVHTFTSPIGTLIPALFALSGGGNIAEKSIWGLRVLSAITCGAAVWVAMRAFLRDGIRPFIIGAIAIVWVLDPKIVDFSMNGMETAFVVFFVTFTWYAFTSGARLWPCAIACAGLQWTRPDGFVFFAAIAAAWMLFGAAEAGFTWKQRLARVIRPIAIGVILYLPWLIIAWSYYGSPIPNTILAKTQELTGAQIAYKVGLYPLRLLVGTTGMHDVFQPTYYFFGGWPTALGWCTRVLAVCAALAWALPQVATRGRVASAAFFLGGFYLAYIPNYPWYFPGWQCLGLISLAYLLHALWGLRTRLTWASWSVPVTTGTALLIVLLQVGLFVCVAWQMRTQQQVIETGHRRVIGLWLHDQAKPGDTVFLECLGYIGYYSRMKAFDFPGLSSREVVATRKAGHRSFAQVIDTLGPDWVVLRPSEEDLVFKEIPGLKQRYQLVRTFDARPAIDAHTFLPGRGYLQFDAVFHVYRRVGIAG